MSNITDVDLFYTPRKRIMVVSGYFDCPGQQHIALFKAAKTLYENTTLIVGINSNECCCRKKGQPPFMDWQERKTICENLKCVDEVWDFDDSDGTACNLLEKVYNKYRVLVETDCGDIVFCNGGDRSPDGVPIPEESWAKTNCPKIKFEYGVGGTNKSGSSSDLLRTWVNNTLTRYGVDFKVSGKY